MPRPNPDTLAAEILASAEGARVIAGILPEWETPISLDAHVRPPFPVDAFPVYLRHYIAALADATQTAPDLGACFVLGSYAGAVAHKVKLQVRDGYQEPLNAYFMPVAGPGERKTPVLNEISIPWDIVETALIERASPDIARQDSTRRMLIKERDAAEMEAAKAKTGQDQQLAKNRAHRLAEELDALPPAVSPQLRTDDCSPERLKMLLAEQDGRIAILVAEGELFKIAAGRYSGDGSASFDALLRGHSGDRIIVDRVGRPRVIVPRPAITVVTAVQPDVVGALFQNPEFRGRGLNARFLYAWPVSPLGTRETGRPMPDDVRDTYTKTVTHLLGWPVPKESVILTLSSDAAELGYAFDREIEPQLGELGALASMTDFGGKLPGAVYRLMGILHLAEYATSGGLPTNIPPVSRHAADGAVALGHYFLAHAKVAYQYGGADPVAAGARKVLAWIRARGLPDFVERECQRNHMSSFPTIADLRPCLELLEDYHHIAKVETIKTPGPGRKPSPVWKVNPATLTRGTV